MSAADELWLREHKGEYIDTRGTVWDCGDDYCGCSKAEVYERYKNLKAPGFVVNVGVWEGPFHTDHEPGAEDDLRAYRDSLPPERVAAIRWLIDEKED